MRQLQLSKPLVVFDLETTGPNPAVDRIVEFAAVTAFPDGRRETYRTLVNPGVEIPAEATAVHGITDADVRDAPGFADIAPRVVGLLSSADVCGFNVTRFDLPLLQRELGRVDARLPEATRHVVDVQTIFHQMEPRTLAAAVRFYCRRELTQAHSALGDAEATLDVLQAQVAHYHEADRRIPDTVPELDAMFQRQQVDALDPEGKLVWRGEEAAINFGKHKGTTLRELAQTAPDYLGWIARKDFSEEVKEIIRAAIRGEFPTR